MSEVGDWYVCGSAHGGHTYNLLSVDWDNTEYPPEIEVTFLKL